MIGYEFEFIVREGDTLLSKEKFLELHARLKSKGWKQKFDPDTGGFTGSEKDGVYVTTDDGVGVMELNMPPTDTVQQSHERITTLLEELQSIYRDLGCSIMGTSTFPGEFDIFNPKCRDVCLRPDCCEKSIIKYVITQRLKENHHCFFIIAANHIWLDLPKEDVARHLRVFNRLSPIIYSLFENGSVQNGADAGILEWRDEAWRVGFQKSPFPEDRSIYGFYEKEYGSLLEYIDHLMDSPPYFAMRDGQSYKIEDTKITTHNLLYAEKTPATWGKGGAFEVTPTLSEVFELQHTTFPHARLKFFLKDGATVTDFKNAYTARDEQALLECFEKFCLEVRSVSAQKKGEASVGPAFVLGLQANIEKTEALLNSQPYSFWIGLYDQVQKTGLRAVYEGIAVAEYAQQSLTIAEEGLRQRGKGEEVFLEPLRERTARKENPAQELLRVFKAEGLEGVYKLRDF